MVLPAKSLGELRVAFDDDKLAADFARGFLAVYAGTALGSLPKSEIDQLVFGLLIKAGVIDPDATGYRIARALNVTPAKARSLLFQHQLRTVTDAETDHQVMMVVTTAKYWRDGDKLSFGVSSPLVRAAIVAKMEEGGVFADISLSGNILRVDPGRFGQVLSSLITEDQANRLVAHLKKKKFVDGPALKSAIEDLGGKLAKDLVKDGAKEGVKSGFDAFREAIGDFFADGGGVDVLDDLFL